MKFLIVLISVVAVTMAQRPTYAGTGPKGRPGLASRFRDDDATTEVPLVNRIGEDGSTPKIPVDARGDADLVDRLNQWPREHRPFWLLNADHIENSRNPQGGNGVLPSRQNQNEIVNRNNFVFEPKSNQNGGIDFQSRSSFDQFDPSVESRTIKPLPIRSSFLGPLRR